MNLVKNKREHEFYCRLFYRVPFSETDGMNIVHHSNHAKYLERGRVEFLRLIGFGYSKVVEQGFHFPVLELSCKYLRPIPFDSVLMIETHFSQLTKTRLRFDYKIFQAPGNDHVPESYLSKNNFADENPQEKPFFSGHSEHCCVNNSGRPIAIPQNIFELLNTAAKK